MSGSSGAGCVMNVSGRDTCITGRTVTGGLFVDVLLGNIGIDMGSPKGGHQSGRVGRSLLKKLLCVERSERNHQRRKSLANYAAS